jgi:hypothetical protein
VTSEWTFRLSRLASWLISAIKSAGWMSIFEGMQPRFRHVPPSPVALQQASDTRSAR